MMMIYIYYQEQVAHILNVGHYCCCPFFHQQYFGDSVMVKSATILSVMGLSCVTCHEAA